MELTNAINKRIESLTWLVQRYESDGNSESTRIATAYETVLEWLKADVAMYGQELDVREGEEA